MEKISIGIGSYIDGGVCAAKGFRASGCACGIKGGEKKDLMLIVSDEDCSAAAVYTTNKVKGAPLEVTRRHLADGTARAIVCNSGNANTCAPGGVEMAERVCALTADALGIPEDNIAVCSTGVIGQKLDIEPFERGIPSLVKSLEYDGSRAASEAIMTTDTVSKSVAVEFEIDGRTCHIGGIAKGSGMIDPKMATMLSFITTDVNISPDMLRSALSEDVVSSFNQICVDGDRSTNDNVIVMANGMARNCIIDGKGEGYRAFALALSAVTVNLSRMLAADGEGATKLIECRVSGAPDAGSARSVSKSVISSDLLKSAMFGRDANWGRVLCAVGYAEGEFETANVDVRLSSPTGSVLVCRGSEHEIFDEEEAERILSEDEIVIDVDLNQGEAYGRAWGCDLTYDYVRINGEYRS